MNANEFLYIPLILAARGWSAFQITEFYLKSSKQSVNTASVAQQGYQYLNWLKVASVGRFLQSCCFHRLPFAEVSLKRSYSWLYKHFLTWAGNTTSANTSKDNRRAILKLVSSSSRETALGGRGSAILDCGFIHAQIEIILEACVTLSCVNAIISCGNKIIEKQLLRKRVRHS